MRRLLSVLLLAAAGCQPASAPPAAAGRALAAELAGRTAGPPQSCITPLGTEAIRIVDQETVAYDAGAILWVNRLGQVCPGLSPVATVIVERNSPHVCRGDRVRGLEAGTNIPGAPCSLRDWVPYPRP